MNWLAHARELLVIARWSPHGEARVPCGRLRHRYAPGPSDHGTRTPGATIEIDGGYVVARAKKDEEVARFFPRDGGGTHTAIMAAALANGQVSLKTRRASPRSKDVADCLNRWVQRSEGRARRASSCKGSQNSMVRATVVADRIETGTYAMAVAMTGAT